MGDESRTMKISCDISVGEAIDKLSILEIKLDRIKDKSKLEYVTQEVEMLRKSLVYVDYELYLNKLKTINEYMWDCNNARKSLLKQNCIDDTYIELTKQESFLNDQRYLLKAEIDVFFMSTFREQKNHLNV